MSKTPFAAAAATVLLCLSFPASAAPTPNNLAEHARFTDEVIGKGPDVILIPGLSTPRDAWRPVAEALKGHYRVHLIQVRGFGDAAGANASGPVIDPLVNELAAYAGSLKRPAVIGHSLGGLIALKLAAQHPDAVSKVMAVDSVPFIATLFDPAATVASSTPRAAQMRDMMLARAAAVKDAPRPAPRDCSKVSGSSPVGMGAMSISAVGMCQIGNWMITADPQVTAQAMYDAMTDDERDSIARIAVPLTVLYAVDDRDSRNSEVSTVFATAYAKAPKAQLLPVTHSAHFIMLDQPQVAIEQIRAFLR